MPGSVRPMTNAEDREPSDDDLQRWIERCQQLAVSTLDSVETPADELVALAAGDRRLMEDARKVIVAALEQSPGDRTWSQMLAFWRRAFEKGTWSWEPNAWDRSPSLHG
jgi:hypothetical protein